MTGVRVLILCFAAFRIAGGVRIKECSHSHWVEIRENNNPETIIICDGFSPSSTVTWTLFSDGNQQANYTCGSSDQSCVRIGGDVVVLRANNGTESHSELVIYRNHRTLAGNGRIRCHEQGKGETASCNTNVIHPADVSDCEVNLNDTDWTASGSCQYQKAFSSNGTYTCTWYRQYPGQSSRNYVTTGVLTKTEQTTEGQLYYSGVCRLPPSPVPQTQGWYSYSVDLLPGPVNLHVGKITIRSEEGDGGVSQGTVIGGAVAGVAAIVVAIAVIAVVVKRKRCQKSENNDPESVHPDAPAPTDGVYSPLDPIIAGRSPGDGAYAVFHGTQDGQEEDTDELSAAVPTEVLEGTSHLQTTSGSAPSTTPAPDYQNVQGVGCPRGHRHLVSSGGDAE